ncbi:MAG: hypothetical protein ABIJ34_02795 [archaeon]
MRTEEIIAEFQSIAIITADRKKFFSELKNINHRYRKIGYLSTDTAYDALRSELQGSGLSQSNFMLIDTISVAKKLQKPIAGVIFVTSRSSITEMRIAFKKFLQEWDGDLFIIDNISDLADNNDIGELTKMLNDIILDIRRQSKKIIFLIRPHHTDSMINDIYLFSDKVIEM